MTAQSDGAQRSKWLVLGAVAAGPLVLFGPMLVRGEALFWGAPLLQFTPWREYALDALRAGDFPLWNPLVGMGAPLMANYQSAFFYPPNWLLLALGVPVGQTVLVMLHLIWAGVGMSALIRSLDGRPLAQAVGGIAFSLSGYLVARGGFLSINAAAAWLPWVILAVRQLAAGVAAAKDRGRPWRAILFLAGVLAMQWLAGHAQTAWYSLIMAAIWGVWELRSRRASWGSMASAVALAGALAFAAAAVQLLPTAEYLILSQRAGAVDRQLAMTYSFWPWRLLGLLLPDLYGSPVTGDFWGYGNYWEDALYIGILPLLLAIAAGWRALRGRYPAVPARMLVIVAGAVLLLALGENTPLFPFLYDNVPSFSLFQAPTRWNLLFVFALALLAGLGADQWGAASGRSLYWLRLLTAGSGVIAVAALAGAAVLPEVRNSFVRAFSIAGVGLFLSGILALLLPRVRAGGWSAAILTFVIVDLVIAGAGLNPGAPLALTRGSSGLVDQIPPDGRIYMDPRVEDQLKFHRSFRFDRFDALDDWKAVRDWGLPNTAVLDRIPSANNFDPLRPGRFEAWMSELAQATPERQRQLLALMGVGSAALEYEDEIEPTYARVPGHARARILEAVVPVVGESQALRLVIAGDLDLSREGIVEGWPTSNPPRGQPGTVAITSQGPNRVSLSVDVPGGGWLLLADTWYPGWRASVDGRAVDIYRVNYLFRGLWLEPGASSAEFSYHPGTFQLGLVLTTLGIVALVGLAVIEWRR